MPGEYKEIVGPVGSGLFFGDYWNQCPDGSFSPFIGVAFCRGLNERVVEVAELQQRVALGGRAVHVDLLAFRTLPPMNW